MKERTGRLRGEEGGGGVEVDKGGVSISVLVLSGWS